VPDFEVQESDDDREIVPTLGLDDRLYTEDEQEIVPAEEVVSGRLYTQ